MNLSESYKNRISFLAGINEAKTREIICYHRSHNKEHLMSNNFKMETANGVSLFGQALYFSESPNTSPQLGKYICKYSIQLAEPILDMNSEMPNEKAKSLLELFNKTFNTDIIIDFDSNYQGVLFGEFFGEISEMYNWDYNKYYKQFIQSLGYNSFVYFGNSHTDFLSEKGDYGRCYGIYNPQDIRFIDGPF